MNVALKYRRIRKCELSHRPCSRLVVVVVITFVCVLFYFILLINLGAKTAETAPRRGGDKRNHGPGAGSGRVGT